jgi:Proton-conducting membrane transporter
MPDGRQQEPGGWNRIADPGRVPLTVVGMLLIVAGFGFKIGAVPFHFWVPDTYQGAPTPFVAFLSVAPKLGGIAALAVILLQGWSGEASYWKPAVVLLSAASMLVGNFFALNQSDVRRLLGFSGIAQVGYVLIGLAADTRPAWPWPCSSWPPTSSPTLAAAAARGGGRRGSGPDGRARCAVLASLASPFTAERGAAAIAAHRRALDEPSPPRRALTSRAGRGDAPDLDGGQLREVRDGDPRGAPDAGEPQLPVARPSDPHGRVQGEGVHTGGSTEQAVRAVEQPVRAALDEHAGHDRRSDRVVGQ